MTIGKKIGSGFCIVIFLTMILGAWAIHSMNEGAEVAKVIARDRLPRFKHWTQMQNDLLETAYFAKSYFDGGPEEDMKKANDFLKQYGGSMGVIKELNTKIHYKKTAEVLTSLENDFNKYSGMLLANQELYQRSEELVENMMNMANEALQGFARLIATMSVTLEEFIDAGDEKSAKIYARNLAAANAVFGRIGEVYQDVLAAERNNDLEGLGKIREMLPEILQNAREVDQKLLRDECHKLFAESMQKYRVFANVTNAVALSLRSFLGKEREGFQLFQKMYKDTTGMVALTESNSDQYASVAERSLDSSTMVVATLLGIVLLLGIIVAVIITRLIVGPLASTRQFAQEVAGGNLDMELDVHTNDETGSLADSLRSMVGALKHNITEARTKSSEAEKATANATVAMNRAEEAARKAENAKREGMLSAAEQLEKMVEIISSASTQLSAQIEQSDKGASESAQRLQEAATAMNQMNATVQEVARNAGAASEASSETREKALNGQHVVSDVVRSIGDVHATSLELKSDMAQLSESAQDISRIMGVISDIADQTNLLALNAAIEAARAGEAGRGFAVVADEVRKLAEKTMASTQDVSNAIKAIQESTSKSMSAVDKAVTSVDQATELAQQSGGALEEIVATVEATSDQMQAIAAASEEQSAASEQINHSIIEVNDMSKLTADAMREASVAVSDLAEQAQRLNELIRRMKNS